MSGAFIPGGLLAMRRKAVAIQPMDIDLNDYDQIIIGCPVWAGYPAPAFNSILQRLPAGKKIAVFLCCGGSGTKETEAATKAFIERTGCTVVSYRDVRTGIPPSKLNE